MHLINPLASGIVGATQGSAKILKRGSLVPTTWYEDFEGASPKTGDVDLDANGGAAVYVNELVVVNTYDSKGDFVRGFTAGVDSPNVELKSLSATGTGYTTPTTGAGQPTTLQAWADSWFASAGATDFLVKNGDATISLEGIAASLAGAQFNVTASPYSATGDGTTDDRDAIQSAMTAASAVNGTVLFPVGDYFCASALAVPVNIQMLGVDPRLSTLTFDSSLVIEGDNPMMTTPDEAGTTTVTNLGFRGDATPPSLTAGDGYVFSFGGATNDPSLTIKNCIFGSSSFGTCGGVEFIGSGVLEIRDLRIYRDNDTTPSPIEPINANTSGCRVTWHRGRIDPAGTGDDCGVVVRSDVGAIDVELDGLTLNSPAGDGYILVSKSSGGASSGRVALSNVDFTGVAGPHRGLALTSGSGAGPLVRITNISAAEDSGFATATLVGPVAGYFEAGARANMRRVSTTNATETIYPGVRTQLFTRTDMSPLTLNFPDDSGEACDGQEIIVGVYANGGANITTTWGTNTLPVSATMVTGNTDWRLARFIYNYGIDTWIEVGSSADTA